MGLDKWIKPEKTDKTSKKQKTTTKKDKESIIDKKKRDHLDKKSLNLIKYSLICKNSKCKYQKTIVKKQLAEEDKICPRCEKEMKIKEV
ncbi:MAG: hypothetical protein ACFE9S_03425 [Candidatus Hermodarchaeota archaeon]